MLPQPTSSITNKPASAASSLYQNCLAVRESLCRVPGFAAAFLNPDAPFAVGDPGPISPNGASDPLSVIPNDPVSQVSLCLRLGSSLCYLFNVLADTLNIDKQLDINPEATRNNLKACKASAAQFIMACSSTFGWHGDDLFTITNLYEQDTNGTVKVINVVTRLLSQLDQRGVLMPPVEMPEAEKAQLGALDNRAKVVNEILESERKYVQDLEALQNYQRQLQQSDVISQDTIHAIFLNLNTLVDFQRRFLIGVEAHASQPPDQQRFGLLFLQMEDSFACYEAYCANFTSASEVALQENAALMKMSHVMEPSYELPFFLIKPIQRICKYPLLLQQLVKTTDGGSPYYGEVKEGLESIKRVTDKVNETKRQMENDLAVVELGRRVEDWKGHEISTFGNLLLEDTFMVIKNEAEREYHVYLFERIILCCKEATTVGKKKDKSNSILKKPPANKRRTSLQLKGRIFINNVISAVPMVKANQHLLQVTWRGDVVDEHFAIRCRQEEQLRQWAKSINKAVEDSLQHRRSRHASARRLQSPYSQFPGTPMSEAPLGSGGLPGTPGEYPGRHPQSASYASSHGSTVMPRGTYMDGHSSRGGFHDDTEDDGYSGDQEPGRITPSGRRQGPATQSMPNSRSTERDSKSRARAMTDEYQRRTTNGLPSGARTPSGVSPRHEQPPSSRASAAGSASGSTRGSTPYQINGYGKADSKLSESDLIARVRSHESQSSHKPNGVVAHPFNRTRSGSNPLTPEDAIHHNGDYHYQMKHAPSLPRLNQAGGRGLTNGRERPISSSSVGTDRSSGESGQRSQPWTAATSPASTVPPHSAKMPSHGYTSGASSSGRQSGSPPTSQSVAQIKFKVNFGEDTFAVAALSTIGYRDLADKVLKKILLCGDRSRVDGNNIRLKYEDEDEDRILLSADEDVHIACEWAREASRQSGEPPSLQVFVSTA
ncbi:uncharacterized protein L969DRAFT_91996 [Mixia osmundae IAM 14324]|uniref:DH domain-containing protein n=1 Tax=Mixia osmundae (strain CBS 9802 / IAM 14324 / JCM 22182 / KY 12970) TaxID=764103 RepID=G7E2X4_MIXOS|nr:uncharacterized protein L969DRAFT_91996 [Mixia osmundae IAM 14324]KEI42557.1 hypothetical protein L969DRAFT_91996 [Mixia osmundae IAM 14324]GAA97155.1 hypothetical protein E5Q_03831 [Mixia osmundae IAM 14324]